MEGANECVGYLRGSEGLKRAGLLLGRHVRGLHSRLGEPPLQHRCQARGCSLAHSQLGNGSDCGPGIKERQASGEGRTHTAGGVRLGTVASYSSQFQTVQHKRHQQWKAWNQKGRGARVDRRRAVDNERRKVAKRKTRKRLARRCKSEDCQAMTYSRFIGTLEPSRRLKRHFFPLQPDIDGTNSCGSESSSHTGMEKRQG